MMEFTYNKEMFKYQLLFENIVNRLTKYPSILTCHTMGKRGIMTNELTPDGYKIKNTQNDNYYFSEKVDGTNTRIIFLSNMGNSIFENTFSIGSRENILYDFPNTIIGHNPAMKIVENILTTYETENMFNLLKEIKDYKNLHDNILITVYGEFYGINGAWKNYFENNNIGGFRIFDISYYDNFDIEEIMFEESSISDLNQMLHNTRINNLKFLSVEDMINIINNYSEKYSYETMFDIVPYKKLNISELKEFTPEDIFDFIKEKGIISEVSEVSGKAEGYVVRNNDRSSIMKLRFQDYERYFK